MQEAWKVALSQWMPIIEKMALVVKQLGQNVGYYVDMLSTKVRPND